MSIEALNYPKSEVALMREKSIRTWQGEELKSEVKRFWKQRISVLPQDGKSIPSIVKLFHHLDDLNIDYSKPRSDREISFLFGSIWRSLQLARLKTERAPLKYSYTDGNDESLTSIIQDTLKDDTMSEIFHENLWRPLASFFPLRNIPIQYILRHEFGDKPITGVDYGTALHNTFPILNDPLYRDVDFPDKEKIVEFSDDVTICLGIGLDKIDREKNYLWTKASWLWDDDSEASEKLAQKVMTADNKTFPFIVADISNQNDTVEKIRSIALSRGQLPYLDCAISLYVGYQLDKPYELEDAVLLSLKNGGIWINVGEELINNVDNLTSYGVHVYRKVDRRLVKIGTPFRINDFDQGKIVSTDIDYFRRPPGDTSK